MPDHNTDHNNDTRTDTSGPVKSAQRVLEVLEFFAETRRPATVKEVAQSLGYPQSSTSVLLRSLKDLGYFDHDARSGMYVPNVRLALATAWIQDHLYSEQGLLRLMEGVRAATGHTVMIGTQQGVHVRYLHVLQATRAGGFPSADNPARTGSLRPLFRSASGRMLLTTLPEIGIARLLKAANAQEPDGRLLVPLEQALAQRRQAMVQGYAVSLGSASPGAAALAVLLPVPPGRVAMTLGLGGPLADISAETEALVEVLRQAVAPFRQARLGD